MKTLLVYNITKQKIPQGIGARDWTRIFRFVVLLFCAHFNAWCPRLDSIGSKRQRVPLFAHVSMVPATGLDSKNESCIFKHISVVPATGLEPACFIGTSS